MDTNEKSRQPRQRQRTAAGTGSGPRNDATRGQRTANPQRRPSGAAVGTRTRQGSGNATRRPAPNRSRRTAAPKQPTPDVVYTQPGPFNRNRFILYLVSAVAVVLALLFGMSIFFKVKTVTVTGNEKYTAWDIREASGIMDGENLLTISEPRISSNITDALPYVSKVRVGIKLPDTVKIEIVELDIVYSVEASDGSWWLVRSDGILAEKTNSADAGQYTKILGVQITDPAVGQSAVAYQPQQTSTEGETVPVTVLASEQLETALSIAQFLESNGVIGGAASIDVTSLGSLELWYADRYQVTLGDAMKLDYKIRSMKSAIEQMGDYQSGILDVSFTAWPEEVGYTPFP